jgi:hypothetical protein
MVAAMWGVSPRRVPVVLLACAAGTLTAPAAAGAQTVDISAAGQEAAAPRIAVDAAGDAFAVWAQKTSETAFAIEAATRPAGGEWQPPQVISAAGKNSLYPQAAVDPKGDLVVVWQGLGAGNEVISAAVRPAGGSWQAPQAISQSGHPAEEPQVAISPLGEAAAVWQRSNGTKTIIQASSHPAGGSWSGPEDLSLETVNSVEPTVAADSSGDLVAAWASNEDDIATASRPEGHPWQAPANIPNAAGLPLDPRLGLDGAGDAVAFWSVSLSSETEVRAATMPAGGVWQAPSTLSTPAVDGENIASALAVNQRGEALAVWGRYENHVEHIQSATLPAGGSWQAAVDLTPQSSHPRGPVVAIDAAGDAVAGWESSNGSDSIVRFATRAAGAQWNSQLNLSLPGEAAFNPSVALTTGGTVIADWNRENNGATRTVQASAFALAGPLIGPAEIPATGIAGAPVGMSAPTSDELAGLAAVNWSFGDGTQASGTSVTHTYRSPGTYAVALSGSDLLENPFASTASITIAAARVALAPILGPLKQSARVWREGRRAATISRRKPPIGTLLSFSLNEAATVRLEFTSTAPGRRVGRGCVAPSRQDRRDRRCRRTLVKGRLTLSGRAGADRVRFDGLLAGHTRLGPGTYRLTATAFAEGLKSASRTLSFTIER